MTQGKVRIAELSALDAGTSVLSGEDAGARARDILHIARHDDDTVVDVDIPADVSAMTP